MSFGDLPISASPGLGLQMHVTKRGFFFLMWVLGILTQILMYIHFTD